MIFTSIRAISLCHLILVYNYNWMHSVSIEIEGWFILQYEVWPFCLVGFSLCCLVFQALLGFIACCSKVNYLYQSKIQLYKTICQGSRIYVDCGIKLLCQIPPALVLVQLKVSQICWSLQCSLQTSIVVCVLQQTISRRLVVSYIS